MSFKEDVINNVDMMSRMAAPLAAPGALIAIGTPLAAIAMPFAFFGAVMWALRGISTEE
jgi:hypothetical protein